MKIFILASLMVLASCSSNHEKKLALPNTIQEAVEGEFRTPSNRARDIYRHPVETLKFFGVEPTMTVVEISPGAGWYLEILAPLLANKGRYIMASPVANKPYLIANEEKITAWRKKYPLVGKKIESALFSPPAQISLPADGTADMVLTFRNVHNWVSSKGEKEAFRAFFKVLKPGGILGVVEHRALNSQRDSFAKSGYVRQQDIIKFAKDAGFRLAATSEVNANPKDTKNYPEGVWTLPPSLKLGDKDREKYLEIGESDRMTLKFVKPN